MAVPTTPAETFGNRFLEPGSRSAALFERARKVLPGGNTRTTVFNPPHPLYLVAGEGCRVTDADGQTRLDFLNNYTSLLHGHGHPEVQAAAQAQLLRGTAFAGPTELEVELAEIITARVPAIERIRFTNSGTEGVMMAIKAARGYTGRPKIAKFEGFYHGTYDPAEVSVNPPLGATGEADAPVGVSETAGLAPGTLENVVLLPYNNREAVERIVEREAANLAAVIVDPLPNNAGFPDPAPGFLPFLRELTQKHGILLICRRDHLVPGGLPGGQRPLRDHAGPGDARQDHRRRAAGRRGRRQRRGDERLRSDGRQAASAPRRDVQRQSGDDGGRHRGDGALDRGSHRTAGAAGRRPAPARQLGARRVRRAVQGDRPGLAVPADAEAEPATTSAPACRTVASRSSAASCTCDCSARVS